jgi:hypothetical protein
MSSVSELPLRIIPAQHLRRARGALGGRGSLHLVERHALVYRRTWLVLASGVAEPLFYLLSIGVGLGGLVGPVNGLSYAAFVAPALLASASMNGALFDSTFNVFFRLKYEKLYDAALATPMRAADVALGEISWALLRGGLYAVAFLVVMAAMGLIHSAWALAALPAALLTGRAGAGGPAHRRPPDRPAAAPLTGARTARPGRAGRPSPPVGRGRVLVPGRCAGGTRS